MRWNGSSSGWAAIAARAAARSTSSCSTSKATAAKSVSLDDALAVLGDTAAIGIDDVVAATFDGELVALDRALDRVFAEGGNPVQLVRALQRHTDQLHLVAGHAANGGNLEGAMFKARGLPRGGPVRQRFERHVRAWPLGRLELGAAGDPARPSRSASRRAIPTRRSRAGCAWRWRRRREQRVSVVDAGESCLPDRARPRALMRRARRARSGRA